jgi:hypothetical protein
MADAAVRLLLPSGVRMHGGAQYAPGEIATFSPDTASQLVALGLAVPAPAPGPVQKSPDHPEHDKMVKGAPIKKGSA